MPLWNLPGFTCLPIPLAKKRSLFLRRCVRPAEDAQTTTPGRTVWIPVWQVFFPQQHLEDILLSSDLCNCQWEISSQSACSSIVSKFYIPSVVFKIFFLSLVFWSFTMMSLRVDLSLCILLRTQVSSIWRCISFFRDVPKKKDIIE